MNYKSYTFRILAAFTVAALLLVTALGVTIQGMNDITAGFEELDERANARMHSLNTLFSDGLFAGIAVRNKVFRPELEKPWEVNRMVGEEFTANLERIRELTAPGDSKSRELLDAIEENWATVYQARVEVLGLVEEGRSERAIEVLTEEEHPRWQQIRRDLRTLIHNQEEAVAALSKQVHAEAESTRWTAVMVGIGALVAGFVVFGLVLRSLRRGLKDVTQTMEAIADGDGDLTRRLDETSGTELADVSAAFNRFAEKIQGLVREVVSTTEQLSSAAEEMSVITRESQDGVNRQRQETDQVASAVDEMAATVQEVARNTNDAADHARDAASEATGGRERVDQASSAMQRLATEIQETGQAVSALDNESEQIGQVLTVISEIADQTNLLALNAAIEAARAGEQGRGFAVVAEEVRTLASRTQDSTGEIRTMIERLQGQSSSAVRAMDQSREQAETTLEYTRSTAEALGTIDDRIGTLSDKNGQIATAAEEQSSVAEELSRNINNIREIADQASNNADQMATSGDELARLASDLQRLVHQFRI
ncbi:methyl-accepting chemotaxis protein [Thiohalospira halophila DSM 15071]|uniref:Methyl-accepting chemotaxis protein n=1 Tax=Thiohalospira halophila DSM 15071 TaxID=1123397 RepID=A0A1I1VMX8_9GAMM|nr:methyl-accepting chemotaxis protein [Thiohalospira halophila]SFD84387.1 methyl-accepting chemotaxis protein [Thiohalospira halophila DSM 15071]